MPAKKIDSNKLDEYKLIIDDAARFTERRQSITNTYITINSLLLTAIAFMMKDTGAKGVWMAFLPIPLVITGIIVCFWWRDLILKYKKLVGLRMDILFEMEESDALDGLEKIYHREEEKLYPRNEDGSMKEDKALSFSNLEARLPILFGVLYIVFGFILAFTFFFRLALSVCC